MMTFEFNTAGQSANESFYHLPRVRNSPIKASMSSVEGLPKKLKIYRISGSKYWQMRLYSLGRYTTKSLKTTDFEEAKILARKTFLALKESGVYVVPTHKKVEFSLLDNQLLLHDVVEDILNAELLRVRRDDIKHASYVMTKIRLEGLVFDFLKSRQLHKLKAQDLSDFVTWLTHQGFATSTIQGYIAQIRKVLRMLVHRGMLPSVPSFPTMKSKSTSRGAFTLTEYATILRKSKELRCIEFDWRDANKIWIKSAYHQMPYEMNGLIRFMVYTFVRPGDIRQIQNKHIEVIRGTHTYLRLNLPEVKRHKAATVSLPAAVTIYSKLLEYQKSRGFGGPDDYVFFPEEPNRRLVLDIAGWSFNWILKDLGLKKGPHGIDRTLYSLRHTAITFRLIYGGNIDLLTLARNARTSVEMIEKFYASTLTAEMNVALIHSKRR